MQPSSLAVLNVLLCGPKSPQALSCRCLQDFPSLILRSQQYTHTNGAVVPLLMAEGTVPMYYQVPILPPADVLFRCCPCCPSHLAVEE